MLLKKTQNLNIWKWLPTVTLLTGPCAARWHHHWFIFWVLLFSRFQRCAVWDGFSVLSECSEVLSAAGRPNKQRVGNGSSTDRYKKNFSSPRPKLVDWIETSLPSYFQIVIDLFNADLNISTILAGTFALLKTWSSHVIIYIYISLSSAHKGVMKQLNESWNVR